MTDRSDFTPVDWDDYPDVAPVNRFDMSTGPASGGVTTSKSPGWPVTVHIDGYGAPGEGVDVTVDAARRLVNDLQTVLDQLQ